MKKSVSLCSATRDDYEVSRKMTNPTQNIEHLDASKRTNDVDMSNPVHSDSKFRAGYVALVGKPNVGKSTLFNALLGEKLTSVTFKPQTTKFTVRGILTSSHYQMILEDTPGLLDPRKALDKAMLRLANRTAGNADLVLFLATPWQNRLSLEIEAASSIPGRCDMIVVINKIDLVSKPQLLPIMTEFAGLPRTREVVPISAKHHDGLDELKETIVPFLPLSPPLYPADMLTDQPERFFVAEILREQLMVQYRQEIPYACAVEIDEFKERAGNKDFIRAVIWVERDSQKAIILGKNGMAVRKMGTVARRGMEQLLGRGVYLELWVKVKPHWRDKESDLARLGFGNRRSFGGL